MAKPKPTPDKDWKKLPMTINEEIEERLTLLHLANQFGDTEWVEELRSELVDLVDTKDAITTKKKSVKKESKLTDDTEWWG